MNQTMFRKTTHPSQAFLKIGLAVIGIALLFGSAILPVYAATQPVMTIVSVNPGLRVTVQIVNLPQNVDFTVTQGLGGTAGIGGGLIAHFNSGIGGSQTITFEIFADLRSATSADIRIDSGTGYSDWANFNPTSETVSVTNATATPAATVITGTTVTGEVSSTSGAFVRILHVEQGGIVIIEADHFPINTEYKISIGPGGAQGIGGYLMAHLPIGEFDSYIATFEIPTLLNGSATLDLRIEAPGFLLIKTFNNVNF